MIQAPPLLLALAALLGLGMAVAGARTLRGAAAFLNTGLAPASDPHMARIFGLVQLAGGALLAAIALFGLLGRQAG